MSIKWSQFAQANSLSGTDQGVGLQNGSNKRFTLNTLLVWIKSQLTAADVGAVPTTRMINNKALSADLTLNASDVGAVDSSNVGVANGVASLDNTGKVPTSQLPTMPSDVEANPAGTATDILTKLKVDNTIYQVSATGEADESTIAPVENTIIASIAHPLGSIFYLDGVLYRALSNIAIGDTINTGAGGNATQTTVAQNFKRTVTLTSAEYTQLSVAEKMADIVYIITDEPTPVISTLTPSMDGVASSGNTGEVSDAGHVHPVDTSRAANSDLIAHVGNTNNPHGVTAAQVGLSNVDNVQQYSVNNPPPYPVISVNSKTGAVTLNATDVGAMSDTTTMDNIPDGITYTKPTAEQVAQIGTNQSDIADIQGLIPSAASTSNQLADKEFVTDSITQGTAIFRGSFATKAALLAVQWQTTNPNAANYVSNNDYAVVLDDETQNDECWRYIYVTGTGWTSQYRINESPLTQAQLDALNSGATAAIIGSVAGKLDANGDGSDVTAAFTAASARANIGTGEKLSVLFGKIAKWFSDLGTAAFRAATGTLSSGSTDLVEAGAVYTGLAGKQDTITASGILKGNGSGGVSAAAAGTDYQTPLVAGTDYQIPLVAGTDYATPAMIPSVPSASDSTPEALGTATSGISDDYSRADHVHQKPTYSASDVGLGNVDNVQQYSVSNPPPYPVTSVNGNTGAVTVSVPSAYTSNPEMDGTASPGSSGAWARGDHVHPTDTSRAADSALTAHVGNTSNPHGVTAAQASYSNTVSGLSASTAQAAIDELSASFNNIDVTVSGADPIVTAVQGHRYLCGTVSTLNFTPSASGICEVIFGSGATAAVLTLPNTVLMPEWWTGCEANYIYDISIVDGIYGAVMAWPSA